MNAAKVLMEYYTGQQSFSRLPGSAAPHARVHPALARTASGRGHRRDLKDAARVDRADSLLLPLEVLVAQAA